MWNLHVPYVFAAVQACARLLERLYSSVTPQRTKPDSFPVLERYSQPRHCGGCMLTLYKSPERTCGDLGAGAPGVLHA